MLNPMGINAGMVTAGKPTPTAGLPPALASLPAGTSLSGSVVGREGPGQLLLRTAAGMAVVASTLKLPRGVVVNLRVRHGGAPYLTIDSVVESAGKAGSPGLGSSLALELNEANTVLRAMGQGFGRGMAVPGNTLASAVLFFMAAVKQGDFTGWFGPESVKALESQGRANLLSRLAEKFNAQPRIADQPPPGDWQALLVPLHDGETVRQLRFFFRRSRDGGPGDPGDQDSRFVVEVEMSRLGGLQLDGLVRSEQFDLVLRSLKPLPDDARSDISEIFADGLAITGQTGKITFQTVEAFPLSPMASLSGDTNQGLLV